MHGERTSLNLTSKKIKEVPQSVYRLTSLLLLLLNINSIITALPGELLSLNTRESSFVFPELICLFENFRDNSLNVLHSKQLCD